MLADRFEPEHRAQEEERRAGRPCLRTAGRGVFHRILGQRAFVSTERLRQPTVEERSGVEVGGSDLCGFLLEPVSTQAPRDERVVKWPNSADVITDRVVAGLTLSQ